MGRCGCGVGALGREAEDAAQEFPGLPAGQDLFAVGARHGQLLGEGLVLVGVGGPPPRCRRDGPGLGQVRSVQKAKPEALKILLARAGL